MEIHDTSKEAVNWQNAGLQRQILRLYQMTKWVFTALNKKNNYNVAFFKYNYIVQILLQVPNSNDIPQLQAPSLVQSSSRGLPCPPSS